MNELAKDLQDVFREVFDDESIVLKVSMTAMDIEGWDSLMNINLIIALEERFGIKFATAEISGLKAKGQNIGTLLKLIASKM
jgi:acyl carrier protein